MGALPAPECTALAVGSTALDPSKGSDQPAGAVCYDEALDLSESDEAELRRIFDMCDVNKTGSIDKRELIKALRKHQEVADFFHLPSIIRQEDGSRDEMEAFFQ